MPAFNLSAECFVCGVPLFTTNRHSNFLKSEDVIGIVEEYKQESHLNIFRNRINYCMLGDKKRKICGTCLRTIKQFEKHPKFIMHRELGMTKKSEIERSLTIVEFIDFISRLSETTTVSIVTDNLYYKKYLISRCNYSFPIVL